MERHDALALEVTNRMSRKDNDREHSIWEGETWFWLLIPVLILIIDCLYNLLEDLK